MATKITERRQTERLLTNHDVYIIIGDELCEVIDINFAGAAFAFKEKKLPMISSENSLEIYFLNGPLVYVKDISYSFINHCPLPNHLSLAKDNNFQRISVKFTHDKLRPILDLHYLITLYGTKNRSPDSVYIARN